ncbi:hypothetical protein [Trabulsiella odontotermitis]|uniref:hypothetical protein n=1 Tax=Trabulsiella odontotermitis TaxID=379893 RepID=UPI0006761B6C|nr:hypothetical protein [Trabulsiella odontotermitis]KNC88843.1 hypothetical protein GM30_10955 [Trabulsiella odontotermitis]
MSEYHVYLFGQPVSVRRTLPKKVETSVPFAAGRLHYVMETPRTVLYGMNSSTHDIHSDEAKKLFDTPRIQLPNGLRVGEFCEKARAEFPDLPKQKAYHAYAQALFGIGYSQLIETQKASLIARFDAAFQQIDDNVIEISDPFPFLRGHLSCPVEVIDEFKRLANQGHHNSQFMAGLLLTTMAGDFSESGIAFLRMAYENRFPRAMDALAEYLLYKEDFLGAVQCHLLSIDSLDDCSHTMDTIKKMTMSRYIEQPEFMPLLPFIVKRCLDEDFTALAKKHYPKLYPSKEEIQQAMINRLLGRGGR